MSETGSPDGGGLRRVAEAGRFLLIAVTVWLGWQVIREPAVARLPVELAIRLSPSAASVLGRAAEGEFAAAQFHNAEHLAKLSLSKAPFNVQALRVLGLATAETGQKSEADNILTLAGNWSLRDDPSHAWLVEYRLSRGDYRSAFAHADTLARRRHDLQPQLFNLFTVAATSDSRAVPVLASLLAAAPPWRSGYLNGLKKTETGLGLTADLAVALASTRSPFSNSELSALYVQLLAENRLEAMTVVRRRLGRPEAGLMLVNGDFSVIDEPFPYEWRLFNAGGAVAEILPDDLHGDSALRAHFGSFASAPLAEQLLQLKAGNYWLSGQARSEIGDPGERLSWVVSCFETGARIGESRILTTPGETDWKPFSFGFEVPTGGCSAQWIRLVPSPGERRTTVVAWYDRFSIVRLS